MTHHGGQGAGLAGPQLTRRAFLGLTAGVVGGLAVPAAPALAAGTGAAWCGGYGVPPGCGSSGRPTIHPANDADYAITVGSWRGAFDAVLHLDGVTSRKGVVSETKEQPMDNKDGYFDEQTAARYDELSADMFEPGAVDPVVEVLAKLAGAGRALELGIGTGRIALPLAARGVPVHGIELSRAMAAQLRAKPGGEAIGVTIGDFATTRVEGRFSVAYLVFNTIMNLTTQEAQVACFRNVAAHLEPGGCFVIEQRVPELRRLPAGGNVLPWQMGPDRWVLYSYDVATQAMHGHYVEFADGRGEYSTIPFRYVWPAELDLMAQLAGLRLRDRWSGWTGEAFTSDSPKHVSIWEKPARSA
jgi:SAM-dependent methyltransferase